MRLHRIIKEDGYTRQPRRVTKARARRHLPFAGGDK